MQEFLPKVVIETDTHFEAFTSRLEGIVAELETFAIRGGIDALPKSESLAIDYLSSTPHDDLVIVLWVDSDEDKRINIILKASHWEPEPLSYDVYVQAVRDAIGPMIDVYNKKYDPRCNLKIQAKKEIFPQISRKTRIVFDDFISQANKNMLHPDDWERFYLFIRIAHRYRIKINADQMEYILHTEGFEGTQAAKLALIYDHGRGILKTDPTLTARRLEKPAFRFEDSDS